MKVLYWNERVVDCTANPHDVSYFSLEKMLSDVLIVCEDRIVRSIPLVDLYKQSGDVIGSDQYTDYSGLAKNRKLAEGSYAEKHKVAGLYFYEDAEEGRKLPVGLSGVKKAVELIKADPSEYKTLEIGIVWDAFGQHNCSDYITVNIHGLTVDYSNQDSYIDSPNYHRHLKNLSELVGVDLDEDYEDESDEVS